MRKEKEFDYSRCLIQVESTAFVSLCVALFPLISSGFIYVTASTQFLRTEQYLSVYIPHSFIWFSTHLSVIDELGWFYLLAILNSVAMAVGM
jgi:hypothetical protein